MHDWDLQESAVLYWALMLWLLLPEQPRCACASGISVFQQSGNIFSNIPKSCFTLSPSHPGALILGPWQSSGNHEPPRKADPKSSLWKRNHLLMPPSDLVVWRTLKRLASGSEPRSDMLCSYSPTLCRVVFSQLFVLSQASSPTAAKPSYPALEVT